MFNTNLNPFGIWNRKTGSEMRTRNKDVQNRRRGNQDYKDKKLQCFGQTGNQEVQDMRTEIMMFRTRGQEDRSSRCLGQEDRKTGYLGQEDR